MAIGRPLVGLYSDSWGRINIAGILTFVCALTVFIIWINAQSFGVMIFFAIINGAICGTFWTTAPPVTAEVVTLKELPSALNLLWLSMIAPLTFSEVIGLALRKTQYVNNVEKTSYLHPQVFAGMMYLAASICMLLLRVWKLGQEDEAAGETSPQERFGKGRRRWMRWAKV
jgi:MFS family permease